MSTPRKLPRRDRIYFVGHRASLLNPDQSSIAWGYLAGQLQGMGEMDLPKYHHLVTAIRDATIRGKQTNRSSRGNEALTKSPNANKQQQR